MINWQNKYASLGTSGIEELVARWLPFTALGLENPMLIIWLGLAFGILHLWKFRNPIDITLLACAGIALNAIYFYMGDPWNLPTVILLHWGGRLTAEWWRGRHATI